MRTLRVPLDDEHEAMLQAMCNEAGAHPVMLMRDLVYALLEDDAAAHGASVPNDGRVVLLRDYRRKAR